MPSISIVMLCFDRCAETAGNLTALLDSPLLSACEFIAIDNGSTDGTAAVLRELAQTYPHLQIGCNAQNEGVARGRNQGFRRAAGDVIVCLDDDAQVHPQSILAVATLFDQMSRAGIITFRVWDVLYERWSNNFGERPIQVANFHGAAHAFRRTVFEGAGLLDEDCTYGAEELDMSIRAHRHGFETHYFPNLVAIHTPRRLGREEDIARRCRHISNLARVLYKHFPPATAWRFAVRCTTLHWIKTARLRGLGVTQRYWASAFGGRRAGLSSYDALPADTLRFYTSPRLSPYFGNSSLLVRAGRRMVHVLRNRFSGTPSRPNFDPWRQYRFGIPPETPRPEGERSVSAHTVGPQERRSSCALGPKEIG